MGVVGVFLAGVFEGVGGRGFDISSLPLPPSPSEAEPAQQCPRTAGLPGSIPPQLVLGPDHPPHHCLSQALLSVHLCLQTYCPSLLQSHSKRNGQLFDV